MLIGSERIDLGLTLIDSAQCFRWTQEGDSFGAVVDRNAIWLTAEHTHFCEITSI